VLTKFVRFYAGTLAFQARGLFWSGISLVLTFSEQPQHEEGLDPGTFDLETSHPTHGVALLHPRLNVAEDIGYLNSSVRR